MDITKEIWKYVVIVINLALTVFFAGSYYILIGILMALLSGIVAIFMSNNGVGNWIIKTQIKSYDTELLSEQRGYNSILVSIAFLVLSMKIGAGIALFIEGAAVILVAICILIASGWLFLGRASGMSAGLAYNISKLVIKAYLFFNSLVDKLAMLIVKLELCVLKIE